MLTHGRTDGERHTIIRPSKDRRITNPCLFHGPLFPEAPTHPFLLAVHSLVACLAHVSDIVSGIDRIQFDSWHAALFEYDRWNPVNMEINTLRLEQNGQHWAYKSFFLKEKFWVKLHCSLFQMAVYAKYDSHVRHNSQSISNGSGNGFVPRRWHAKFCCHTRVLHKGLSARQIQPNLSFGQVGLTTWLSNFKYQYARKFLYQPRKWLFGQPARKLSADPCIRSLGLNELKYLRAWDQRRQQAGKLAIFKVKVEWSWRYRSRSKVITYNTPSHASDHLYQIWLFVANMGIIDLELKTLQSGHGFQSQGRMTLKGALLKFGNKNGKAEFPSHMKITEYNIYIPLPFQVIKCRLFPKICTELYWHPSAGIPAPYGLYFQTSCGRPQTMTSWESCAHAHDGNFSNMLPGPLPP